MISFIACDAGHSEIYAENKGYMNPSSYHRDHSLEIDNRPHAKFKTVKNLEDKRSKYLRFGVSKEKTQYELDIIQKRH